VFFFHSGGVVEVGIEKAFGGGALGFHGGTESRDPCWRASDVFEGGGAEIGHASPHFFDQIGDKCVEHAVEGFIDHLLGLRGRILRLNLVVKTAEERDVAAHICHVQDARVETIIEVRCQVGDLVGEIDELCLEWRTKIEEIFSELRMGSAGVIA
jgi:hypothetical protein